MFGRPTASWPVSMNLTNLNLPDGISVLGSEDFQQFGKSVAGGAVDVNHDGIHDAIIGAPQGSPLGRTAAGKTFVLFGKKNWTSGIINTSNSDWFDGAMNGFVLFGEVSGSHSGCSVNGLGDVNHDGIQDFIIGADNWDKNSSIIWVGRSYVLFGRDYGQRLWNFRHLMETMDSLSMAQLQTITMDSVFRVQEM